MELLIDTSVWVSFLRSKTPPAVRQLATSWVNHPEACGAKPIFYELRRSCGREDRGRIDSLLETVPLLDTPSELWEDAVKLGRLCLDKGHHVGPIDLLNSAIALCHGAELVSFDEDYVLIASVSKLKVRLLQATV